MGGNLTARQRQPEAARPRVLRLIDRADEIQQWNVAADPLENFIRYHGQAFVERIQARARGDAKFRRALVGVWGWEAVPEQVNAALLPFLPPKLEAAHARPPWTEPDLLLAQETLTAEPEPSTIEA